MVDSNTLDWGAARNALVHYANLVGGRDRASESLPERLTALRRALSVVYDAHPEARMSVLQAIETIKAGLLPDKVRFAKALPQDQAWRTPSILNLVIAALEPVLATLLPTDTASGWESWQASAILPLSKHLHDYTDCFALAKALRRMHADLDHALEHGFAEADLPLVSLAEGLKAVADALEQVGKAWPGSEPRWCACCFRRAPRSSRYCNLHRSGDSKDTVYRRSMRTRKALSEATEIRWTRHQAIRLVLKEPMQWLVSHDNAWMPLDGQHAVVSELVGILALRSELVGAWAEVHPLWDAFIRQGCPEVAKRVGNLVTMSDDWWDFCRKLHKALDNRFEDTSSPLSILYLLVEAEDWFAAEQVCRDRRITDNGERILFLFREGIRPVEISRQLGLSRQYVSRYLKDSSNC